MPTVTEPTTQATKIIVSDDLPASATDLLRSIDGWVVDATPRRSRSQLLADIADAQALIVRSATKVDAELIQAAPRLRVIARAGTGVDNVDLDAASARGILVLNAPGANSISVAEHALALMLALARSLSAADAAMKQQRWEKKRFMGGELRDKVLGIVGLGRVGQEVAHRARSFGMRIVAHDPFIAPQVAEELPAELVSLDELCARADYITLHSPSTPETRKMFNAERFARCKRGVRIINTARGELVDEAALLAAIESGIVGGAGLDVFETEPPPDWRLPSLPQVIATPHIAASTAEAQEQVGLETAASVRDFLCDGIVRNAVNFPAVSADEFARLKSVMTLANRLGAFAAQLSSGRTESLGIRYYGDLAAVRSSELIASAVLVGFFKPILSNGVTLVNARSVATARGIEVVESRSTRTRSFTSLLSIKVKTNEEERWIEAALFEPASARLVLLDGVAVEAPLDGTLVVIANRDQPGVIGDVGTILGRHGVNIATFALGRSTAGAVGVVNVDERSSKEGGSIDAAMRDICALTAVKNAKIVRLS